MLYSIGTLMQILSSVFKRLTLIINSLHFCCYKVLVIIDAKPKDLGLPTDAYVAVEEVHDVSVCKEPLDTLISACGVALHQIANDSYFTSFP